MNEEEIDCAHLIDGGDGGERQDVGTRDDSRARSLGRGLDIIDHAILVQEHALDLVLLRQVGRRRVQKNRRIAPLREAVVEEEAQHLGRRERVQGRVHADLVRHDLVERRASLVVEPEL